MSVFSAISQAVSSTFNVVTTTATTLEASVKVVAKTVDAVAEKADDLHANWTENSALKRKRMLQHAAAEHDKMHGKRMLAIEKEINADPELANMIRRIRKAEGNPLPEPEVQAEQPAPKKPAKST